MGLQGLVANEIGCARISMMAREQNTPVNGPNTDARDQLSPDRHIQLAPHGRSSAARLAAIPAGESPANRGVPVTVVVISSDGEGDRPVESLEVKAPVGRETGQIRTGGPAT